MALQGRICGSEAIFKSASVSWEWEPESTSRCGKGRRLRQWFCKTPYYPGRKLLSTPLVCQSIRDPVRWSHDLRLRLLRLDIQSRLRARLPVS